MENGEFNNENNKDEVKEVAWQTVENNDGGIRFRQKRSLRGVKRFFKAISLILVAALAGGASGAYIVSRRDNNKYLSDQNKSILNENLNTSKGESLPKNSITKVAEAVAPAVVGINNKGEGYFGDINQGSGSGIIFSPDGYIVTNNHVIENAQKVSVKLSNGKVFDAKIVGADKTSDLAVIKIDVDNLPTAKFGDSSKVKVGDVAIAIGNPLGEEFAGTVTSGIISALNRRIQMGETIYKVLQTDAAINPGNSGGALCNEAGEVIGINSLKLGSNSGMLGTQTSVEGMGFAISINEAKGIIKSLMTYGKVSRPFIGIAGFDAKPELNNGVEGAYVQEIVEGSGAARSGIRPTDIIIEADNIKITKFEDLSKVLENKKVGDTITCKVWRAGKTKEFKIVLTEKR